MKISSRLGEAKPSATLAVQQAAAERKAGGVDIVDLGLGEPDFPMPKPARDGAIAALEGGRTKYTATAGVAELRDALAARYVARHGGSWTREQVLVSAGAKQALYNVFMTLFEPGDEVILPTPCWVSFPDQIRLAGAVPVEVFGGLETGFQPDPAALERALSPRSRAIVLNSPSNPTGAVLRREVLGSIVELCRGRDLVLIYDETYDHFLYGGAEHCSAASFQRELGERLVIVNSFSKTYAMTGLRLGFALGAPDLVRAAAAFQSHTTSNASSIAQYAALAALQGPQDAVEEMLREYRRRCELVVQGLAGLPGVELNPPAGAFYAFPRIEGVLRARGLAGSVELARLLLDEARVAVVPGVAFGAEGHLRLSFATSTAAVEEGLRRLRAALGELRSA